MTLRRGIAAETVQIPRRVRFTPPEDAAARLGTGGVEVPYHDACGGGWEVEEEPSDPDAMGARQVRFEITRSDEQPTLRFSGLFDGERILGEDTSICLGMKDGDVLYVLFLGGLAGLA